MDGLTPTSRSERYIANNFLGSFVAFEKKFDNFGHTCFLIFVPFQKSARDSVNLSGHWTAPHIKGKLGHNLNSKLAGQCALFSFSNLTAVPNEFPI